MAMQWRALYAWLLLFTAVSAFFPEHQGSEQSANRLGGTVYHSTQAEAVLEQRDAKIEDEPGVFISIVPFRSESRYQIRSKITKRKSTPVARDNQYVFSTAAAPSAPTSLAVNEDGTDYSYFSAMSFGSAAQNMFMLIDTGSPTTWVMDSACKSGPCAIHNQYDSSKSTTSKPTGEQFRLDYGTGDVSGSFSNDTVSFAGIKLTVPVGLAETVSDDFQNYPFDGILGLGRQPTPGSSLPTFLQVLIASKVLPANVFGVNLQRISDKATDGEINFGAPDTTKYHGDLNWTDTVADKTFWEIPADDIFVDGKSVGLNMKRSAIVDTGTSYMYLPPNDAKVLFGAIKGAQPAVAGSWALPCDTTSDIQMVLNGVGYSISPKDYIAKPSGGQCKSTIMGVAAGGNDQTWVLGDTFLKNVYTVFDADKNRIGFGTKTGATKIGGTSGTTSSATVATQSASSTSAASAGSSSAGDSTAKAPSSSTDAPSTSAASISLTGQSWLWLLGLTITIVNCF